MNKALQSYTPRVRPLEYDSLQQDLGCQPVGDFEIIYNLEQFATICVFEHDDASPIYNQASDVSYTLGPVAAGGKAPYFTPWAAWVASAGIRFGKFVTITPPADVSGTASALYPTTKPERLSLGFTRAGQPAIAIQKTASSIELKYTSDDGLSSTATAWTGYSPLLFNTIQLHSGEIEGEADLVCLYLKLDQPNALLARFERDGFLVEKVIHDSLQAVVVSLLRAEADGRTLILHGRDKFGRDVAITSRVYPATASDEGTLDVTILAGSYTLQSVPAFVSEDRGSLTLSVYSGVYGDVVQRPVQGSLNEDASTLDISIVSGEYL